jgi:hypothetical protein
MSNALEIPTLLKGSWDHLLILTYGADLAFFENAIWRQLSNRCKNKIILADGRCYLQAYQDAERNDTVRYVNQNYVFDGIFTPHAAHSKVILLTNAEEGRLLVGSGNLGMPGYASGGELFTQYEYNNKSRESLSAFAAIRSLLERLIDKNALQPITVKHINHLFDNTPWLYHSAGKDQQVICHNLDESMLQQLKRAVGKETVEEVWVLSPFYDPEAKALEQIINDFSPKQIHLLIQPGLTSASPKALRRVTRQYPHRVFVHPFSLLGDLSDVYVHAKLYLLKTKTRSICMQGSPNLSQVAMMRTFQYGNLELANLAIFPAKEIQITVLDSLQIHPATTDFDALDLEYRDEERPSISLDTFVVRGGDWDGKFVTIHFSGTLPNLHKLGIGDMEVLSTKVEIGNGFLKFEVSPEYQELLDSNMAVHLILDGKNTAQSNPVYLWHRKKLSSLLNVATSDVPWTATGELNLGDEELENLLIDLDANLIIDRKSIWRVAKKDLPPNADENDEVLKLTYANIDYEQLRRHPRIQQYKRSKAAGYGAPDDPTPLQALLASILEHFQSIHDIRHGIKTPKSGSEELPPENEEELDENGRRHRRVATQRRIRRILKNFVRRYIRGLESRDFQELVGPEVLVKNYTIFSHILWRLLHRDEVEHEFIAETFLNIWGLFWGSQHHVGIFQRMEPEFQGQALQFLREHKSDSQMLASMYYCSIILMTPDGQRSRLQLRNFLRRVLEQDWLPRTTETLEATWVFVGSLLSYEPPTPLRIIRDISLLASFETTGGLLDALEKEFKIDCRLEPQVVYREAVRRQVQVESLVIKDQGKRFTLDLGKSIVQRWQEMQEKDYYRIVSGDGQRIFQYESARKMGSFYLKATGEFEEFDGAMASAVCEWKSVLDDLSVIAQILEKQLSITIKHPRLAMELA